MAEKKKYVNCNVPLINSNMRILGTPTELKQKTIKLDLTRKLKGKGLTITFQIFENEEKLFAIPKKLELVKPYIQRMMRKRIDYVEDSFSAQTSDLKVTIKPFLITRKRVSRAVRRNLRNTTKEFLIEYVKTRSYNELCEELMDNTLQKTLLPKLKKVYPLSFCDLRVFETKEIQRIDLTEIISQESEISKENSNEETVEEELDEEVSEDDSTEEEEE